MHIYGGDRFKLLVHQEDVSLCTTVGWHMTRQNILSFLFDLDIWTTEREGKGGGRYDIHLCRVTGLSVTRPASRNGRKRQLLCARRRDT